MVTLKDIIINSDHVYEWRYNGSRDLRSGTPISFMLFPKIAGAFGLLLVTHLTLFVDYSRFHLFEK